MQPWNQAQVYIQMKLRIPLLKVFFFQTSTVFLDHCYDVVFQDRSGDYVGEDYIIDRIDGGHCTLFHEFTICYVVLIDLHHRKYWEIFLLPSL